MALWIARDERRAQACLLYDSPPDEKDGGLWRKYPLGILKSEDVPLPLEPGQGPIRVKLVVDD